MVLFKELLVRRERYCGEPFQHELRLRSNATMPRFRPQRWVWRVASLTGLIVWIWFWLEEYACHLFQQRINLHERFCYYCISTSVYHRTDSSCRHRNSADVWNTSTKSSSLKISRMSGTIIQSHSARRTITFVPFAFCREKACWLFWLGP